MNKPKRALVLRALAGFLAVWLAFAGATGWLLVRRAQDELALSLRRSAELLHENWAYDSMNGRGREPDLKTLQWICFADDALQAAAVSPLLEDGPVLATDCVCSIQLDDPDPTRVSAAFSLTELLNEEQFDRLLEALRAPDENGARPGAFVSGWVRGDRLYPYRLIVAVCPRERPPLGRPSWNLTGQPIRYDWRFDPEEIWQTAPGWLGSGRSVENALVTFHFRTNGTGPRSRADFLEQSALAQSPALRERAAAQRQEQFAVFGDSVILLHDGLPRGQYFLYAEIDGWEYTFAARADPLRSAAPKIAAVWLCGLLLIASAGGLVCRGLCKVFDRQAALEQNRRNTANALAHDLKTPLALIQGYAENLQFGVRPEKHARYLAQLLRETRRMDGILGGFLELSRLETGTLPLHREPIDLRALAEEYAERYRAAAETKRVALQTEGGGTLSADRELLDRALDNLLSNALRHTPEGGTVAVTLSPSGLAVENTGAPIPPEALPRLFEAYYTGDRSRAGGERHGLGLAVVRAVAERHGLRAVAENTETGVRVRLTKA